MTYHEEKDATFTENLLIALALGLFSLWLTAEILYGIGINVHEVIGSFIA